MSKHVLSVGQCGPDHSALSRFLKANFSVQISTADTAVDALDELRKRSYDLVLINRKLDADYTDGMDIVRAMRADATMAKVPLMLVTNYAESQQEAVAAGAVYGFGKNDYQSSDTVERLRPYLA